MIIVDIWRIEKTGLKRKLFYKKVSLDRCSHYLKVFFLIFQLWQPALLRDECITTVANGLRTMEQKFLLNCVFSIYLSLTCLQCQNICQKFVGKFAEKNSSSQKKICQKIHHRYISRKLKKGPKKNFCQWLLPLFRKKYEKDEINTNLGF